MSMKPTTGEKRSGTTVESSDKQHCERCARCQPTRALPRSDRAACAECGLILEDGEKPDSEALRLVEGVEYKSRGGAE